MVTSTDPPAATERLTAQGIVDSVAREAWQRCWVDHTKLKLVDREIAQLYAARDERDRLQAIADKLGNDIDVAWNARDKAEAERDALVARVRVVAERLTEHRNQCDRLGRLSESTITRVSMAGRAEVYEQVAAEFLAILGEAEGCGT